MRKLLLSAASVGLIAAPAVAEVSDGTVKIGILNDQSGVYSDFGGQNSYQAALMAVEDFGGTVLGAPVEVVTADHQNKPDIASNIARQWYDTEQVDSIMELTTSSVALAVQALSREKNKVTITTGAATTELTGAQCSPYGFHWAYDTHALAVGTGGALVQEGGDSWFFLTADYAFGYSLEEQTSSFVTENGGTVTGSVRHPLASTDFSSFLLQAQASGAKVIGLANAGADTQNAIKQAAEFGITQGGQKLAALLFTLADVHGLGAEAAITGRLRALAELSQGTQGLAGRAGLTWQASAASTYTLGWREDPTQIDDLASGERHGLTLGAQRRINDDWAYTAETVQSGVTSRRSLVSTYGVSYTPDDRWRHDAGLVTGRTREHDGTVLRRTGLSLGTRLSDGEDRSAQIRGEWRRERSQDPARPLRRETWLAAGDFTWRTSDDWRLVGELDSVLSRGDDDLREGLTRLQDFLGGAR